MQYKNSRRQWVKLWVNEWLSGTVRFQLTAAQRSLWADMLALAGASRLPGIVASGETNGQPTAYPPGYLSSILRWDKKELQKALRLFVEQDRITIKEGVIYIVNWQKYQSEYQRQAPYRKKVTGQVTQRLPVEGEGDVEGEREGEKKAPSVPCLPEWMPEKEWAEFLEMRQRIRAPLTEAGRARIIVKLTELRAAGHDPQKVLGNSIENSWRGVFAPNGNGHARQSWEDQQDAKRKDAIARGTAMAKEGRL